MTKLLEIAIFFSPAMAGVTMHYNGKPGIGASLTAVGFGSYFVIQEMTKLLN